MLKEIETILRNVNNKINKKQTIKQKNYKKSKKMCLQNLFEIEICLSSSSKDETIVSIQQLTIIQLNCGSLKNTY